jgi:Histidine kinase-, DNA gyrase B-, and HSP90-like ATPase
VTKGGDHLRVGAHVLVQLGGELVTDVEQAILECVKNSYDADAAWCRIEIDTKETGSTIESGPSSLRRFNENSETVSVEIFKAGKPVTSSTNIAPNETVERRLTYTGRITIEDNGDGLSPDRIRDSWLVISRSGKRAEKGSKKTKTTLGRTSWGQGIRSARLYEVGRHPAC